VGTRSGQTVTTSTIPHGPSPARLSVEVVRTDRIEVAARGAFTSALFDDVASRLARLIAGAPALIQVDCSQVTSMAPEIADLFAQTSALVAARGGELQLIGVPVGVGLVNTADSANGGACSGVSVDSSFATVPIGDVSIAGSRPEGGRSSGTRRTTRAAAS
jgi:anti-anti-sigma regulatory factor